MNAEHNEETESLESQFARQLTASGEYGTRNGDVYKWTGAHYERLADSDASREAWDWLGEHPARLKQRTAKKAQSCTASACLNLPTLRSMADAPRMERKYIVPTRGKWLEVLFDEDDAGKTSNARIIVREPEAEPARAVFFSVPIEIKGMPGDEYRPSPLPRCSRFSSFLQSAFPAGWILGDGRNGSEQGAAVEAAEALRSVQEYAGETLLIGRAIQKAHLWLGEGANGKGVMMGLLSQFHRTKGVDLAAMDGFAMEGIQDASLALVDETPKDGFNEARLKSLLGGGQIPVDRKNKAVVTVVSKAKWIVSSNLEFGIRCKNSGEGFWRRFIMVPWKSIIPESDRIEGLDSKIFEREGRMVLDWMLAGLLRCLNGGGSPFAAAASAKIKSEAILNSDIVLSFLDSLGGRTAVVSNKAACTRKDLVYEAFRDYCAGAGRMPINAQEFWTRIKKAVPSVEDKPARDKSDGNKVARFVNLSLEGCCVEDEPQAVPDGAAFFAPAVGLAGVSLAEEVYGVADAVEAATNATAKAQSPLPKAARTSPAVRGETWSGADPILAGGGREALLSLLKPSEPGLNDDEMREYMDFTKEAASAAATAKGG